MEMEIPCRKELENNAIKKADLELDGIIQKICRQKPLFTVGDCIKILSHLPDDMEIRFSERTFDIISMLPIYIGKDDMDDGSVVEIKFWSGDTN